jgi:hypothetical protein
MENFLSLQLILPRTHRTLVRAFNLSQLRKLEREEEQSALHFCLNFILPQRERDGGEQE